MKETVFDLGKRLVPALVKYKYIILIMVVGIALLMLPDTEKNPTAGTEISAAAEENFSVAALEDKLEQTLSEIEGAGTVHVMLTVQSGMKRVLAQDIQAQQDEGQLQKITETVIISTGSGTEETILIQQVYPEFQGALIVAEGGADPNVKLKLTQAVAALTGLGADKISICKGK